MGFIKVSPACYYTDTCRCCAAINSIETSRKGEPQRGGGAPHTQVLEGEEKERLVHTIRAHTWITFVADYTVVDPCTMAFIEIWFYDMAAITNSSKDNHTFFSAYITQVSKLHEVNFSALQMYLRHCAMILQGLIAILTALITTKSNQGKSMKFTACMANADSTWKFTDMARLLLKCCSQASQQKLACLLDVRQNPGRPTTFGERAVS